MIGHSRARTWAVGATAAALGGAVLVHTDGIDFHVLEPLWLTVGLFVMIPGLWGLTMGPLTTRLLLSGMISPRPEPSEVDGPVLGAAGAVVGWAAMAVVAAVGVADLVRDVARLS